MLKTVADQQGDGNGYLKNAEIVALLDSMPGYTDSQKAAIFGAWSTGKNPYS